MKIRMSISNVARYYLMLDAVSLFCHLFVSVLCHYSVCISLFPLSVNERYTCLWKCTPCNLLSFSWLCAHNLTPKLNTLCAPALRHYAHTHAHTYKQPCNDTDSSPAGRCQTPGRSKPRTSPSRCFYFILFYFFVSGRDVRGKLREWVSTEHHEPGKQKVVGETSSDVCVCILMENSFRRDTHVWFLWFDKFNFAKKKGNINR